MGELFQSWKAKQFRHQRDAALEKELKDRHLFSDCPEIFETHFRCVPTAPDVSVVAGDALLARPHPSLNGSIEVIQGMQSIAIIEGSGAQLMHRALQDEHRTGGLIPVSVINQSPLSRTFTVRYSNLKQ